MKVLGTIAAFAGMTVAFVLFIAGGAAMAIGFPYAGYNFFLVVGLLVLATRCLGGSSGAGS